jgi:hypothetical protein
MTLGRRPNARVERSRDELIKFDEVESPAGQHAELAPLTPHMRHGFAADSSRSLAATDF